MNFLTETRLAESDPPFRAPAIWQDKSLDAPSNRRRRSWEWNERTTAAFLGFAAGLIVIVPAVFVLSTAPDQDLGQAIGLAGENSAVSAPLVTRTAAPGNLVQAPTPKPTAMAGATAAFAAASTWTGAHSTAAEAPEAVSTTTQPTTAVPKSAAVGPGTTAPAQPVESVIEKANTALADGRVTEARATLRTAASPDTPHLWFLLAQTYDPLLNEKATRPAADEADNLAAADIQFAIYYYTQALTHGVEQAKDRLDALAKL